MTYARDPPGLQIFTMVQPAVEGGESVFGDGFAVADELRSTDPEAFQVLCNTIRTYRSVDKETGWHLKASGPVIQMQSRTIAGIRHNDLDRLPDLPPADTFEPDAIKIYYKRLERAHASWDELLAQDKFRLVMKLQSGDTMVVANQVSLVNERLQSNPSSFEY
jgi:alpha-ketoglutarate-dependent taurine dioxygenase